MTNVTMDTDVQAAPGVGPRIAQVLLDLGYSRIQDLRGADPEAMFDELCTRRGAYVDRCVLYVFRSAVYFAEHTQHDPELLKWWNWKDKKAVGRGRPRRTAAVGSST